MTATLKRPHILDTPEAERPAFIAATLTRLANPEKLYADLETLYEVTQMIATMDRAEFTEELHGSYVPALQAMVASHKAVLLKLWDKLAAEVVRHRKAEAAA